MLQLPSFYKEEIIWLFLAAMHILDSIQFNPTTPAWGQDTSIFIWIIFPVGRKKLPCRETGKQVASSSTQKWHKRIQATAVQWIEWMSLTNYEKILH